MAADKNKADLDSMAGEIFELIQLSSALRMRKSAGANELSETEFITLDILSRAQNLTIGEIQKQVGVVPAQMSRIIRALEENRGKGYVHCEINPQDRRRVNVSLTQAGTEAYDYYREARLASVRAILAELSDEDRGHFMRVLRLIRVKLVAWVSAANAD